MDFDIPKVYGDTFISDGLVFFQAMISFNIFILFQACFKRQTIMNSVASQDLFSSSKSNTSHKRDYQRKRCDLSGWQDCLQHCENYAGTKDIWFWRRIKPLLDAEM